jgi:hypothetical protein
MKHAVISVLFALATFVRADPLTIVIADYATLPMTGSPDGDGNNAGALARINTMRQEPSAAARLFVDAASR